MRCPLSRAPDRPAAADTELPDSVELVPDIGEYPPGEATGALLEFELGAGPCANPPPADERPPADWVVGNGTDGLGTVGAGTVGTGIDDFGTVTVGTVGTGTGTGTGTVGVGTVGVVIDGMVTDGTVTVGVGSDGVEMVGTVRAGLGCGCTPSTACNSNASTTAPIATRPVARKPSPARCLSPVRTGPRPLLMITSNVPIPPESKSQ